MKNVTLSQAFNAFIIEKKATGKSLYTVRNYEGTLKKVMLYFKTDPNLNQMTREDWVGFFSWLQDEYLPDYGKAVAPRPRKPLSPKSINNVHTDISSFYSWATRRGVDLTKEHLLMSIERPEFEPPLIETFTKEQIKALLKACDTTRPWKSRPGQDVRNQRPCKDRDRAIIMLLLSTGVRAEELCNIKFKDLDLGNRSITVSGKGKGRDSKPRLVYFGKSAYKYLMLYIRPRITSYKPNDNVFMTDDEYAPHPISRSILTKLLRRLGERAEVPDTHAHRFRHTFATEFLRNGGDVLKLQILLGHSSLDMVKRYANIVGADCAEAHEEADPGDRWRL
jgi:site-specific recombinase XerD